jgi:hypothetical protein
VRRISGFNNCDGQNLVLCRYRAIAEARALISGVTSKKGMTLPAAVKLQPIPDREESAYSFFVYEAHQPADATDFPA